MSNTFSWDFAICKWEDRKTATYYPVNNVIGVLGTDSINHEVLFDAYGRNVGEPDFGVPRLYVCEERDSTEGYIWRAYEQSTTDHKVVVYRRTGAFFDYESKEDIDAYIAAGHNVNASAHQDIRASISSIVSSSLKRVVVDTLPTENIDPNTIYMIPASDPQSGNAKDEYMYINNTWEKIGTTVSSSYDISTFAGIQQVVRAGKAQEYFEIGDIINVTHSYFGNIDFQVVAFDKATPVDSTKTHSMTLCSYSLLKDYFMFDQKEPTNPDTNRSNYGNNRWLYSNIRQWLNSSGDAGSWYTAQHDYDAAPPYATTHDGFKKGLPSDFLAICGMSKIISAKATVDGGGYDETEDMFFLPSRTEIFNQNNNNVAEGTNWTELFGPSVLSADRVKYRVGYSTASNWWLRSCYTGSSCNVYTVYTSGGLSNRYANGSNGVSPAVNII